MRRGLKKEEEERNEEKKRRKSIEINHSANRLNLGVTSTDRREKTNKEKHINKTLLSKELSP